MDSNLTAVITAGITVVGIFIAAKYKNGIPKKPDRVELLFNRYDSQYKSLEGQLTKVQNENETLRKNQTELKTKLDDAMRLIGVKDDEIKKLQSQVESEEMKRKDLLKRFNTLKAKYEKADKGSH